MRSKGSPKLPSAEHTGLQDSTSKRISMNDPVSLSQSRKNLLPSTMSGILMELLHKKAGNWWIRRKKNGMLDIIRNWCLPNSTTNSHNSVHDDWVKRSQPVALCKATIAWFKGCYLQSKIPCLNPSYYSHLSISEIISTKRECPRIRADLLAQRILQTFHSPMHQSNKSPQPKPVWEMSKNPV